MSVAAAAALMRAMAAILDVVMSPATPTRRTRTRAVDVADDAAFAEPLPVVLAQRAA